MVLTADKIASSLSILSCRSISLSDRMSFISSIDSVMLGGSEVFGLNVVLPPLPPEELSDGTLSKLGYSWSFPSISSSESLRLLNDGKEKGSE